MQRILAVAAICGAVLLVGEPAIAGPPDRAAGPETATAVELSAQSRKRPRARITVRPPRYPYRTFHTVYPLPYDIEYPGPGHVRECRAKLRPEWRASGTVIVPRTTCWWVRG